MSEYLYVEKPFLDGVTPTSVDVRELGNRWASCSPTGALSSCLISDYRERKEWLRKNGAGLDV